MNEGKHRNAKLEKELEKLSLNQHSGYGKRQVTSPKDKGDPSKDILELQTK